MTVWALDVDGTLLDLPVHTDQVRATLRDLFLGHGVDREFRPILSRIDEAAAVVAVRHGAEAGEGARRAALEAIADAERACAGQARPRVGAGDLLRRIGDQPTALVSNTDEQAIRLALHACGLHAQRLIAIVGRRADLPPKPDPAPLLRALSSLATPLGRVVYVGDRRLDMAMARAAAAPVARRGGAILAVGIGAESARQAELRAAGADLVVPDLASLAGLAARAGLASRADLASLADLASRADVDLDGT